MKKPYLTLESIRRAVKFLERRKAHAVETGNSEWADEYMNAVRIIRGLCVLELEEGTDNTDAGKRGGR